jgi:Beta-propeller repeat
MGAHWKWTSLVIAAFVFMLAVAVEAQAYAHGELIFAKRIGSSTSPATSVALATAPNGATVIAGWKEDSSVPAGIVTFVARYTAAGRRAWLKVYDTLGSGAEGVACDRSGNVYVAATFYGANQDIGLLKYDAAGRLKWKRSYDGAAAGDDWAEAIAVDRSGNVLVAGRSYAANGRVGVVVLKYRPNGDPAWPQAARYDSDAGDPDAGGVFCKALAVDAGGNAYVAGWLEYNVSGTWTNSAITLKFGAADGVKKWDQVYVARDNPGSYADNMTLRGSALVITGSTEKSMDFERDALIVKYSLGGVEKGWMEWGVDGSGEFFSAAALDEKGNAYVTGDQWLVRGTSSDKAITMKLNATLSTVVWQRPYQPAGRYASGWYITRDGLGNIYVAGGRSSLSGDRDIVTMKYSPSGVRRWLKGWSGGGPHDDEPYGLALGTDGGVYVTGSANASGDYGQAVLLKYQP